MLSVVMQFRPGPGWLLFCSQNRDAQSVVWARVERFLMIVEVEVEVDVKESEREKKRWCGRELESELVND